MPEKLPWWHGRCREIAEYVNLVSCATEDKEVTPWQVEQVLIGADRFRSGRVQSVRP